MHGAVSRRPQLLRSLASASQALRAWSGGGEARAHRVQVEIRLRTGAALERELLREIRMALGCEGETREQASRP
jgi:hypothetical protein